MYTYNIYTDILEVQLSNITVPGTDSPDCSIMIKISHRENFTLFLPLSANIRVARWMRNGSLGCHAGILTRFFDASRHATVRRLPIKSCYISSKMFTKKETYPYEFLMHLAFAICLNWNNFIDSSVKSIYRTDLIIPTLEIIIVII